MREQTAPNKLFTKDGIKAWAIAVGVLATFATIATVAATTMMKMEAERQGYRPIEVTQPISFFDKTYLKKEEK